MDFFSILLVLAPALVTHAEVPVPKDLTKKELIEVLDIIEGARSCSNPLQLKPLLLKAGELVLADYSICGLVEAEGGVVKGISAFVNGNYPEEWCSTYMERKLYINDPVVNYHMRFSMAEFWSNALKTADKDISKPVLEYAGDFGLKYGISSSIYVPGTGQMAMFAFSGARDRFSKHHKRIVDILTLHLNRALLSSTRSYTEEVESVAETGTLVRI